MYAQSSQTANQLDQSPFNDALPRTSETSLESSATSRSRPIREREQRPRLARVDMRPLTEKDLERLRLGVVVKSVHYEPGPSGSLKCAVLLRTTFMLQTGNRLKFAMVPMSVRPTMEDEHEGNTRENAQEPQDDAIDIVDQYPRDAQWAEVSRIKGTKDISLKPQVSVSALGSGGSIGGIGTTKRLTVNNVSTISLKPVQITLQGRPTQLQWQYEDENGIFYPTDMDLLVIVQNWELTSEPESESPLYFPFQLHLEKNMIVDIHGQLNKIVRLVTGLRSSEHKGWFFNIRGKYMSSEAEEALRNAEKDPNSIGLHASVKHWLAVQKVK